MRSTEPHSFFKNVGILAGLLMLARFGSSAGAWMRIPPDRLPADSGVTSRP